jgi:uncharacterized protein (DUF1330 family)
MAAYLTVRIDVSDPSWVPDYEAAMPGILQKYGGRYIARDMAPTLVEGNLPIPQASLILEFPDKASAQAFVDDADYAPHKRARQEGAKTETLLLDGV